MIDGKLVKKIYFTDGSNMGEIDKKTLKVVNDYHGTYCIDWIALYDESGEEIQRWNTTAQTIESIEWLEKEIK